MKHGICKIFSANVADLVKINMNSQICFVVAMES